MAIFGDILTIRTFIDPFTTIFPCVTPYGEDKVILSESRHLAVLYDLNTCLPIKCWTFSELDSLVAPFIFDSENEKFIAVKKSKVALYKCDSEDDLIQIKKEKRIHCLLASPANESLVLFKNGFIRSLKCVIAEKGKYIGTAVIPDDEEIIKTTVNQFNSELSWVALLTRTQNAERKLYTLKADFITSEGRLEAVHGVKQSIECLTVQKDGIPIGLTRGGEIYSLNQSGYQLLVSLQKVSIVSALCLPEDDALAVVVQEDQTHALKVVNLKYKVTTSQLPLDIVPLPDFISHSNGYLFIASRKAMLCIQYEIKPASLASVMGKNLLASSTKDKPSNHIFLDSSTDIKLFLDPSENVTLDELKKQLPQSGELLSEKAIFSALATVLRSKCFSSVDDQCREVLDTIISRPFNHNFMVNVIKSANLNTDQFVQIIEILTEVLKIDSGYVIDWLNVILDACLKLLLFSKGDSIRNTLKRLSEKLDSLDESMDKCREISTILDDLLNSEKSLSINQMYNGVKHDKYCIELLEL